MPSSPNISSYSHAIRETCHSTENIGRIISLTMGLAVSILNFIEIVIITKLKKKKIYEVMLLSLSVSDCMFRLPNTIVSSILLSNPCRFEEMLETFHVLYLTFILASIFHLTLIALDRAIFVLKPLKHRVFFTKRKAHIAIAVIWLITLIIGVSLFAVYVLREKTEKVVGPITTTGPDLPIYQFSYDNGKANTHIPNVFHKEEHKSEFQSQMQFLLSIFIIVTDITMIISYAVRFYVVSIKRNKIERTTNKRKRLPVICLAIGVTFIICTICSYKVCYGLDNILGKHDSNCQQWTKSYYIETEIKRDRK